MHNRQDVAKRPGVLAVALGAVLLAVAAVTVLSGLYLQRDIAADVSSIHHRGTTSNNSRSPFEAAFSEAGLDDEDALEVSSNDTNSLQNSVADDEGRRRDSESDIHSSNASLDTRFLLRVSDFLALSESDFKIWGTRWLRESQREYATERQNVQSTCLQQAHAKQLKTSFLAEITRPSGDIKSITVPADVLARPCLDDVDWTAWIAHANTAVESSSVAQDSFIRFRSSSAETCLLSCIAMLSDCSTSRVQQRKDFKMYGDAQGCLGATFQRTNLQCTAFGANATELRRGLRALPLIPSRVDLVTFVRPEAASMARVKSPRTDLPWREQVYVSVLTTVRNVPSRLIPSLASWLRPMKATLFFSLLDFTDVKVTESHLLPAREEAVRDRLRILLAPLCASEKRPHTDIRAGTKSSSWTSEVAVPQQSKDIVMIKPPRGPPIGAGGCWKNFVILYYLRFNPARNHPWFMVVDDDTYHFQPSLSYLFLHYLMQRQTGPDTNSTGGDHNPMRIHRPFMGGFVMPWRFFGARPMAGAYAGPSRSPVYPIHMFPFTHGGAGIVMNRNALGLMSHPRAMVHCYRRCSQFRHGDVRMGCCATLLKIAQSSLTGIFHETPRQIADKNMSRTAQFPTGFHRFRNITRLAAIEHAWDAIAADEIATATEDWGATVNPIGWAAVNECLLK